MSRIVLNHGSYTNLLQLQQISRALNATQNILSTGKKVNSAIDNPSSYYTARSLNSRAEDLSGLLDSMSQKIQTIKVASEGIEAATSFLEQMTSVAERAIEVASSVDYLPKSYPSIFVKQLGNKAQAAYACTQFYAPGVAADDETFGQGQWYLPSIGELMEADGYDVNAITTGVGSSGGDGKNQVKINAAIQTLIDDGVEADQINTWYWSSSEYGYAGAYAFCSHYRDGSNKIGGKAIRCFLYLENIFSTILR